MTLLFAGMLPASATSLSDKRASALQVKAQVDELDQQLEIAAEAYNEARSARDDLLAKVTQNQARANELSARQTQLQTNLTTRATSMYRQGKLGLLEVLLGSSSFKEFATLWGLLQDMNTNDAAQVADLKQTRAELGQVQEQLAAQQAEAQAQLDVMKSKKASIEAQLAERQQLLSGIEAEIVQLQREEEAAAARRAAAARAAARAAAVRPATDFGTPTGSPHTDVVAVALSKLGAPYRWGAAGPDAFDCSGFTMWCYSKVGIALPHSSRAQISVGERVSRANLKPGDLVFFGTSTIHHVGIYIGNGNFVHAPNTGETVRITSLDSRSDYVGACRP